MFLFKKSKDAQRPATYLDQIAAKEMERAEQLRADQDKRLAWDNHVRGPIFIEEQIDFYINKLIDQGLDQDRFEILLRLPENPYSGRYTPIPPESIDAIISRINAILAPRYTVCLECRTTVYETERLNKIRGVFDPDSVRLDARTVVSTPYLIFEKNQDL